MNPPSISMTITQIDDELIYDTYHILMNYLKMNSFSSNCFSETDIKVSQSIINSTLSSQSIQNYNQFSTKYFTLFTSEEKAIDLMFPLISNYPNSELGLFLSVLLNKHVIDIAQSLNDSKEKFEKYKNYLLNIYHSILQKDKKQKLLESICSSITALILIGINGNWTNGIELLIRAAKENNDGNFGNILMASLIISNINYIFEKLKEKLSIPYSEYIFSHIKLCSNIIEDFTTFLITVAFNGPKEDFVNTPLFGAFIGILQSFKYFDINIIRIHGFIDFLINCISFLNVNKDLIVQICDIFEYTFSDKNNIGLILDYKLVFKMDFFSQFLMNINNHKDFQEIQKCVELINNVKNYYSKKDINEIKSNAKDVQILFASSNIFGSLIENFTYLFFHPDLDTTIQDIYFYFINLPIYSISQILLNSLNHITIFVHYGYNFNNYSTNENIQNTKKQNFKMFLYKISNSVFQNMKISSLQEYNDLDFSSFSFKNNYINLDKNISEVLKGSISNDEKVNYIINATEFYENLYDIINDLYGIKDYCDKLCQYLISSINNNDVLTIDCILMIFNKIAYQLKNNMPEIIFNLIDFLLNGNDNKNNSLLSDKRFVLQFMKLVLTMKIYISHNKKIVNLIIQNLLNQKYDDEKLNLIIINIISQLINISYQLSQKENKTTNVSEEDKSALMNIFNTLSQYLIDNIAHLNYAYLLKVIESLFKSCFFNIFLSIFSNEVVFNIAEKLLKDAYKIFNKAFTQNNNKKELYMKYIHIIFSVIKNIGNESNALILELFNKNDSSSNPVVNNGNPSYFSNIENNVIIIINECSEKSLCPDNSIINSVILLYVLIIDSLKENIVNYYNNITKVISLIHEFNPKNMKELELTISLYKNIFSYCKNNTKYNEISEMFFDTLNIMNAKFNVDAKDEDKILLSKKICEFVLLFISHFPQKFAKIYENDNNNKNNNIFVYGFNNLIYNFENNDNEEYNMIFTTLIKTLCENIFISSGLIRGYIDRLTKAIITHLQLFKSTNSRCFQNYFIILKCFSLNFNELFMSSIKRIFNNDIPIIYVIDLYFNSINYNNYNNLDIKIKDNNKSFIKEMGELLYAIDKNKADFVSKYDKLAHGMQKKVINGFQFDNTCERTNYTISLIHK